MKSSYEVWHSYKTSLQNLKIFGCLCFTYVPQVKRDKLDRKVEASILLAIAMLQKATECINLKQKR